MHTQYAYELRCYFCGSDNAVDLWPQHGDIVPYFNQAERGAFSLPVDCPSCNRTWHVVWDDNPGPFLEIEPKPGRSKSRESRQNATFDQQNDLQEKGTVGEEGDVNASTQGVDEAGIKNSIRVINLLMKVLPQVPRMTVKRMNQELRQFPHSKYVVESKRQLHEVMRQELRELEELPDFDHFQVTANRNKADAEIVAFCKFRCLLIRIWKCVDKHHYVGAYEGFAASEVDLPIGR